MKSLASRTLLVAGAALAVASANAAGPEKHPHYQHALAELQAARWNIEHRGGNAKATSEESVAIQQIDQVIVDIKRASLDEQQALHDPVMVNAQREGHGNLHRADELLKQAHADIAREEDDASARGLRDTAIHHLDDAMVATHKAIEAVQGKH